MVSEKGELTLAWVSLALSADSKTDLGIIGRKAVITWGRMGPYNILQLFRDPGRNSVFCELCSWLYLSVLPP